MRRVPAHRGRENLSRSLTTQANKIAPCKVIQDGLGFWILRRGSWISDSLSVELTFRGPVVSGIPGSLSWILGSKTQDSMSKNFPDLGILTYLTSGDKKPDYRKYQPPKKTFDRPCHLKSGVSHPHLGWE